MIFTSAFTTNAMALDFLSLISLGWVVMFLDSHCTVVNLRTWIDLLDVSDSYFHSKNLQITYNYWNRVTDITGFGTGLGSSSGHTRNFCPFGTLSCQEYVSKGITHPVFYGDLVFKLRREKEGDLTQSYDKNPYTNRKFENQRTTHTNATKNFDYTTIADRLRTVSWSNK